MSESTPKPIEKPLKVGQRVDIVKDAQNKLRGTVAYVGTTLFSPGKWIGVILDEPKGKNNGTVMGKTYFSCKESHGMFVRQNSCIVLDDGVEDNPPRATSISPPIPESPAVFDDKLKVKSRTKLSSNRLPILATPKTPSLQHGSSQPQTTPLSSRVETQPKADESVPSTPKGDLAGKRAIPSGQFIETGFVETLKTQFTPGQALSPSLSMAIEERVSGLQLSQENENLKAEIRDLNEKLETLKVRRNQDKEKLKEADKMRLQLDQLLEFKRAILESQSQLQKELARVKQEAKDALIEQQSKNHDSDEYQEMLEMATLDKEMAEEKAESLQLELEQAKQKVEELALDLELLKAEMSEKGIEGAGSSLEIKQLEQQNIRMKETLVKMRDLAAHEKHQHQRVLKEMEDKLSELNDLKKAKQSLTTQVEEKRAMVTELQEQVDAALGAEEMVEQLTDRNLALEEKIGELQDAVADLEQLHDMNEELQETARETELELREELDISRTKIQEMIKERDAIHEMVADRNGTIDKFREVVQQMQQSNLQLREALERETNKPVGAPPEVIDYQKMFTETKTFTKTIDLELRKLDVQQALQHVSYLCTYMPDSFMGRGGDYHSVQQLLLMSRLLFKCDMLAAQVKEKFPGCAGDLSNTVKSAGADQCIFGARFLHWIFALQGVVRQFSYALNSCSPQQFLEMGTLHQEMLQQEKAIDFYVELLRKDQLDENVQLEALEKVVTYFNSIYAVQFSSFTNGVALLTDHAKVLLASCCGLTALGSRVQSMMQSGHEGSDVAKSIKEVLSQANQWQQYARTIKRRLPTDGSTGPINLPVETTPRMTQCAGHLSRLLKTMLAWCRMVSQQLSVSSEPDSGVAIAKMRELAHAAADQVYTDDYTSDNGFFDSIHASLSFVNTTFSTVSNSLVDGQYDFDGTPTVEAPKAPVGLRAQTLKAEIRDLENLRHKLDERESLIKELNIMLRNKQEELSEMNVRKEMTEKKLSNLARDNEVATEKLTRKLEDNMLLLKRKEKEFNETLEHLQSDMATLEKEKAELKEKLMHSSKKVLLEGLTKSAAGPAPFAFPTHAPAHPAPVPAETTPSSSSTVHDSPLLLNKISHLREALRQSEMEKARLMGDDLRKKFEALPPLRLPAKNIPVSDDTLEVNRLIKQAAELKRNILRTHSQCKFIDPTDPKFNQKSNNLSTQLSIQRMQMERDVIKLQAAVARLAASRKPGAEIRTATTTFPIPELSKAMNDSAAVELGHLSLPLKNTLDGNQPLPLVLGMKEIRHLHQMVLTMV